MPDVTGEEFQVFISLLSKLKTLEFEHDQMVDLIAEQAELENELQVSADIWLFKNSNASCKF